MSVCSPIGKVERRFLISFLAYSSGIVLVTVLCIMFFGYATGMVEASEYIASYADDLMNNPQVHDLVFYVAYLSVSTFVFIFLLILAVCLIRSVWVLGRSTCLAPSKEVQE